MQYSITNTMEQRSPTEARSELHTELRFLENRLHSRTLADLSDPFLNLFRRAERLQESSVLRSIVDSYLERIPLSSLSEEWMQAINEAYRRTLLQADRTTLVILNPIAFRIIEGALEQSRSGALNVQSLPLLRAAAELAETRIGSQHLARSLNERVSELEKQKVANLLSFLPGSSLQSKLDLMKIFATALITALSYQSQLPYKP